MWEVEKELVDSYLQSCSDSVKSQEKFNNFRRDERLHPILEHVSYEEGLHYLNEIKKINPSLFDIIYKVKENDLVGNPILQDYPNLGFISPTTIRYVKNVYDIASEFVTDQFKIENVVEIGGGYGGLCRMMNALFSLKQYLMIDLEEVNHLSKKYLQYYYGDCSGIAWISPEELLEVNNIQLCISNYSFSECNRKTQQMYYNKVIRNSNTFYITYNHISDNNMSVNEFKELASNDFYVKQEEEVRSSHTNYVLYGYNRDYFDNESWK
jgi:hypothetical protein